MMVLFFFIKTKNGTAAPVAYRTANRIETKIGNLYSLNEGKVTSSLDIMLRIKNDTATILNVLSFSMKNVLPARAKRSARLPYIRRRLESGRYETIMSA